MNAHVLNCATIRLYLPPIEVASCCLLVESSDGLILVDTGLGTRDHSAPSAGLWILKGLTRAFGLLDETAVNQIAGLGYSPSEVRHIVMTHLHIDHAGGLGDFPSATVHLFKPELETAMSAGPLRGLAYVSDHWAHGPNWRVHEEQKAVDWFGFPSLPVVELADLDVLLVPLPGHTRWHCGVAVGDGSQWILHCGDAVALGALQTRPSSIAALPLGPHFPRLRELSENRAKTVLLMPAHVRTSRIPVLDSPG
jgi:glyoxylase-like metal-dependent hydrolase (beta-lactamase superfamily II)